MSMTRTEKDVTESAFAAKLPDGVWVVIRRLEPADADAVLILHKALSQRERYLRFFTMQPVHLKALADRLTAGQGEDIALGAFDSGTLIGVANYAICGKPATADVAVVVAHDDQIRGVGTALLRRLVQIARAKGIQHLVADVLTSNHLLLKLLRDAGLQPRGVRAINGVVHLDIDLPQITTQFGES
jgi:L-amino acid N-acyltransferase YncA